MKRFALIRTDRMGDLLLSLPAAEAVKEAVPDAHVCFVVSPSNAGIARACPFVDEVIEYSESRGRLRGLIDLARRLRRGRYDAAVFLRPTPRAALAAAMAGVPLRAGTAYRFYSRLFNRRVPEHRRNAGKHESEFNLALLAAVTGVERRDYRPRLELDEGAREFAGRAMRDLGLAPGDFAVVHPGSGGSARNLSIENYARLAGLMEDELNLKVVVTCGPGEEALIDAMDAARGRKSRRLEAPARLLDLAGFLSSAALFVSGSTGPMHIAAAAGAPVLAFFSPVRSCSPRRWGPLSGRSRIILPPVPECPTCAGEECRFYDCMDRIDLSEAVAAARELIR